MSVDGVTGIEVPNRNVESYAEAIRKLADDSRLREELGKNAKKRVEELFLSTDYYENIRRVVEGIDK